MMRVISSPSNSTTGFWTLIFAMGKPSRVALRNLVGGYSSPRRGRQFRLLAEADTPLILRAVRVQSPPPDGMWDDV